MSIRRAKTAAFGAVALTAVLLWASTVSGLNELFGFWHWAAHFGAYAALAFLWRRGMPRAPAQLVAAALVAFGFAQEAIEILGHAHGFELADALVDAVGTGFGILLAAATSKKSN